MIPGLLRCNGAALGSRDRPTGEKGGCTHHCCTPLCYQDTVFAKNRDCIADKHKNPYIINYSTCLGGE